MNVLERFFEAITREEFNREGIHVTALVHDCLRKCFYSQTMGNYFNLKTLITFWIGKQLHKTPILKQNEVPLKWEGIFGTVDDYEDGVLVEKKTCNTKYNNPLDHHKKQVEYYSVMLRKNDLPFKEGHIVYINLVDKEVTEFEVSVRDIKKIQEEMIIKKEIINKAIETGEPPKRHITWLCNYCEFANICFGSKIVGGD